MVCTKLPPNHLGLHKISSLRAFEKSTRSLEYFKSESEPFPKFPTLSFFCGDIWFDKIGRQVTILPGVFRYPRCSSNSPLVPELKTQLHRSRERVFGWDVQITGGKGPTPSHRKFEKKKTCTGLYIQGTCPACPTTCSISNSSRKLKLSNPFKEKTLVNLISSWWSCVGGGSVQMS